MDGGAFDPVNEGRLLEVFHTIEPRCYVVTAGDHLTWDFRITSLVRRPQAAAAQCESEQQAKHDGQQQQIAFPIIGQGGFGRGH